MFISSECESDENWRIHKQDDISNMARVKYNTIARECKRIKSISKSPTFDDDWYPTRRCSLGAGQWTNADAAQTAPTIGGHVDVARQNKIGASTRDVSKHRNPAPK